jgi:hypothetical protein
MSKRRARPASPLARAAVIAALTAFFIGAGFTAAEAKRLALVVGNGAYVAAPPLKNATRDAADVATMLGKLGFEVTLLTDVPAADFWPKVEAFAAAAQDAEGTVFYYAGHAFQMSGVNYLLPVDATLVSREALRAETWSLDGVIARIQDRRRQTLVFLDACRNDPLPASVRGSAAADGLARIQTGVGTFVAFATEPGGVTFDGAGDAPNSPFTTALLKNIETPGLSVSDMMIKVRNEVEEVTGGRQTPWDQSSLREQFYFQAATETKQELSEADYELLAQLSPEDRAQFLELLRQSGFSEESLRAADDAITVAAFNLEVAEESAVVFTAVAVDAVVAPVEEEAVIDFSELETDTSGMVIVGTEAPAVEPAPELEVAAVEPAVEPPSVEPAPELEVAAVEPPVEPPAVEPAPELEVAAVEPAVEPPAVEPAPELEVAAVEPAVEPPAVDPAPELEVAAVEPAVEPAAEAPAVEPAPELEVAAVEPAAEPTVEAPGTVTIASVPETVVAALPQDETQPPLGAPLDQTPVRLAALTWQTRGIDALDPVFEDRARVPGQEITAESEDGRAILAAIDPSLLQEPAAPVDTGDLARTAQAELARLGCYRMKIDGSWGKGSRTALTSYFLAKKTVPKTLEPTAELVAQLQSETQVVCAVQVARAKVVPGKTKAILPVRAAADPTDTVRVKPKAGRTAVTKTERKKEIKKGLLNSGSF